LFPSSEQQNYLNSHDPRGTGFWTNRAFGISLAPILICWPSSSNKLVKT
jgi:hypothetical protein